MWSGPVPRRPAESFLSSCTDVRHAPSGGSAAKRFGSDFRLAFVTRRKRWTRVKSAWRGSAAKFGVVGGAVLHAPRRKAKAATGCGLMSRWSSARIESRLSRLGRAIHSTLSLWTRAGWSSLSERGGRRRLVHQLVEAVRMHVRTDPPTILLGGCAAASHAFGALSDGVISGAVDRSTAIEGFRSQRSGTPAALLLAPQLRLGRARDIGGRNTWLTIYSLGRSRPRTADEAKRHRD